jgi:hypothetical protein
VENKMKKSTIIGIAVGIIALGAAITLAKPNQQSSSMPAMINSPASGTNTRENSYDFGQISMRAGTVKKIFTIQNENPLMVKKIYTSCMCTTATLNTADESFGPFGMPGHGFIPSINAIIQPQQEANIEVVFDPAAHGPAGVGRIERIVVLETDGEPLEFSISATVTP